MGMSFVPGVYEVQVKNGLCCFFTSRVNICLHATYQVIANEIISTMELRGIIEKASAIC